MKGGTLCAATVGYWSDMLQLWVNLDKQPSAGAPLQQYVGPSNNGWGHCKRDWNALIHLFHCRAGQRGTPLETCSFRFTPRIFLIFFPHPSDIFYRGAPLTGDFSELSPSFTVVAFSKGGSDTICQGRFIYTKPNYRVLYNGK